MSAERDSQPGTPFLQIDSCEVIEVDCTPVLTDEEKTWPVVALRARVGSSGTPESPAAKKEVGIRVSIPGDATPDEAAAVVQKLRAMAEDFRSATGGRFPIHIDAPAQSP
jgi:hypothetical protein